MNADALIPVWQLLALGHFELGRSLEEASNTATLPAS